MATLKDMVDEVKGKLAGYTLNQDRISYLASAITTTSTQLTLGNSDNLTKGIIEIDDELIWVDSFTKSSNTLSVIPGFGRGFQGTSPTPHSQYAQVTLAPAFPRVEIKKAINDTIGSVFPRLFAMASTTFTYNPAVTTYALPDDCEDVFQVTWQVVGPSREWKQVNRWRVDKMANSSSFNSTNTITIHDFITPGRTVQVWYRTSPNYLTNNSEDFADVTGLPESTKDVIVLGAAARMLSFVDAGRINVTSAEADAADSKIPSTAGAAASKLVYALYVQRLNDESNRLNTKYPIRPHYTH